MRILLFLSLMLVGVPVWAGDLQVLNARVRLMPPGVERSAAYMTLRNNSGRVVTVVGVRCGGFRSASFHDMRVEKGMMTMQAMPSLSIPPHGQVELSPGGRHLMLMGPEHALRAGERVTITLMTDRRKALEVVARVVDMR